MLSPISSEHTFSGPYCVKARALDMGMFRAVWSDSVALKCGEVRPSAAHQVLGQSPCCLHGRAYHSMPRRATQNSCFCTCGR